MIVLWRKIYLRYSVYIPSLDLSGDLARNRNYESQFELLNEFQKGFKLSFFPSASSPFHHVSLKQLALMPNKPEAVPTIKSQPMTENRADYEEEGHNMNAWMNKWGIYRAFLCTVYTQRDLKSYHAEEKSETKSFWELGFNKSCFWTIIRTFWVYWNFLHPKKKMAQLCSEFAPKPAFQQRLVFTHHL